jgi:hypothetical protein
MKRENACQAIRDACAQQPGTCGARPPEASTAVPARAPCEDAGPATLQGQQPSVTSDAAAVPTRASHIKRAAATIHKHQRPALSAATVARSSHASDASHHAGTNANKVRVPGCEAGVPTTAATSTTQAGCAMCGVRWEPLVDMAISFGLGDDPIIRIHA